MGRISKKVKIIIGIVLALMIAGGSVVGIIGGRMYIDSRMPAFAVGGTITIEEGETLDDVMAKIEHFLHPLHPKSLKRAMDDERTAHKTLHVGSYHFKPEHTARYVARAITLGWQTPVNLTISGRILRKETLASIISNQMMLDSADVMAGLCDTALLYKYGTTPEKVFEIILPDTYQVYWDWDMDKILGRLKKEHDLYWNEERTALAKAQGLTPEEVSILASIVSEETNKAEEFPKIASVYLTRLHKGIKLQACPTICYIYDYTIRRVLFRHLENPSPYNTYMYAGLPPGPISLPDKKHIEAVLHPDKHNYMYFCADPSLNGYNIFAETYSEHVTNANNYRSAMDARAAAKKAEEAAADAGTDMSDDGIMSSGEMFAGLE